MGWTTREWSFDPWEVQGFFFSPEWLWSSLNLLSNAYFLVLFPWWFSGRIWTWQVTSIWHWSV